MRDCQITAIENLEDSFKDDRPRALIQMATGSGKTFTAITSIYRLLKHADAKRILFLVDTKNLGEQAEQEFMAYVPNDDNRKFTELYNVQRLKSSFIAKDSQVCISTIQRMYSILKGEELDEAAEEINPAELRVSPKQPLPVVYNPKIPPEFFDFIIIDECHRSIYNLWRQVIEYFDAFLIGLTATPDNRTYGFFQQERRQRIHPREGRRRWRQRRQRGLRHRNRGHASTAAQLTRRAARREARAPHPQQALGDARTKTRPTPPPSSTATIVNPDQIRTVIRTFRDKLPEIFPGRDGGPEDPDLRQDRQPRRRHHPDRPRGVRRGQRLLQEDHLPDRRRPEVRPRRSSATTTTRASPSPWT